jgi:hypothetical protein
MYTYAAVDDVDAALAFGGTAKVVKDNRDAARPRPLTAYFIGALPYVM